jgi:hypothetical protein
MQRFDRHSGISKHDQSISNTNLLTYLLYFIPLILIGFDKPRDVEQVKDTYRHKIRFRNEIPFFTIIRQPNRN